MKKYWLLLLLACSTIFVACLGNSEDGENVAGGNSLINEITSNVDINDNKITIDISNIDDLSLEIDADEAVETIEVTVDGVTHTSGTSPFTVDAFDDLDNGEYDIVISAIAGDKKSTKIITVVVEGEGGDSSEQGQVSEPTDESSSSEDEKSSEEPVSSEEPKSSEEPVSSEEPKSSEEPVSSEEPKSSEEPVSSEEPKSSEEPVSSEEPKSSEDESSSSEVVVSSEEPSSSSEEPTSDLSVSKVELSIARTPQFVINEGDTITIKSADNAEVNFYATVVGGTASTVRFAADGWDEVRAEDTSPERWAAHGTGVSFGDTLTDVTLYITPMDGDTPGEEYVISFTIFIEFPPPFTGHGEKIFPIPRVQFFEDVSTDWCGPCYTQAVAFGKALKSHPDLKEKLVSVVHEYGSSSKFPKANCGKRVNQLGANSYPSFYMDGDYTGAGIPSKVKNGSITNLSTTNIGIVMAAERNGKNIKGKVTIYTDGGNIPSNLKLHVYIIEDHVEFNSAPGSNGQREFHFVNRAEVIFDQSVSGLSENNDVNVDFDGAAKTVVNESELSVIAFIQSGDEVINAARIHP